jgi:hypothetical protein
MSALIARTVSSLAAGTSLLAVVACYGTLGLVALLSLVGVTVEINEMLVARILTAVLAVALLGMLYSYRMHRDIKPFLLGTASAALLLFVFYGAYSRPLEALGFVGLVAASVWDLRAKHRVCGAVVKGGNPVCR